MRSTHYMKRLLSACNLVENVYLSELHLSRSHPQLSFMFVNVTLRRIPVFYSKGITCPLCCRGKSSSGSNITILQEQFTHKYTYFTTPAYDPSSINTWKLHFCLTLPRHSRLTNRPHWYSIKSSEGQWEMQNEGKTSDVSKYTNIWAITVAILH